MSARRGGEQEVVVLEGSEERTRMGRRLEDGNDISNEVVRKTLKIKMGKAPGVNGVCEKMLNYGGEVLVECIADNDVQLSMGTK